LRRGEGIEKSGIVNLEAGGKIKTIYSQQLNKTNINVSGKCEWLRTGAKEKPGWEIKKRKRITSKLSFVEKRRSSRGRQRCGYFHFSRVYMH
jgi:hypothetical protein